MDIFKDKPENWRELEWKVTEIFSQCGFIAYNNAEIQTVRGTVNVDVLAIDNNVTPNTTVLIECKHWNANIPQTVIHSFRTIVNDYGANHGLIICKNGFQSGSYEAIKNTNIKLLNWNEFLEMFELRWLQNSVKQIHEKGYRLRELTDRMSIDRLTEMTPEKIIQYNQLCEEFEPYSTISHKYWFEHNFTYNLTPKECIDRVIDKTKKDILSSVQIDCYYDYFNHIINKCIEGQEILEKFIECNKAQK